MRRRLACPSLHRCICFLLLCWPLIKITLYTQNQDCKTKSNERDKQNHPEKLKSQRSRRVFLIRKTSIDEPDNRLHRT
ncbi:hypothetical protein CIPAW_01G183900 [Carya illinoinensis]|uniref:Secreted protein n=1 Tax=Carya illinoinensis TaxID=32201 RepID=A0A8T1RP33_CARIL|nr:hypothetical protein CIPAW_01G183900 [Carya illinoinensis]